MTTPKVLVPSNVPTDPKLAKDMIEKIQGGVFDVHPDYKNELMEKLNSVISGNYMDTEDPFEMEDIKKRQNEAQEREKRRNMLRTALTRCVDVIESAEQVAKEADHSYKKQYKISQAKTELLGVLKSLEEESALPGEMILLTASERNT